MERDCSLFAFSNSFELYLYSKILVTDETSILIYI